MPLRLRAAALILFSSLGLLALPARGRAAITVLGNIPCADQADGARFCQGSGGTTASDGQNILDANVTLPSTGSFGAGPYPLVIVGHGYGGAKQPYDSREAAYIPSAKEWAAKGYAVLNVTDRGFGGSCGKATSVTNLPNCVNGYVRLLDTRYEVRDVQFLAGRLVDQGLVAPTRIGAVGESYGGGLSLMLATLHNRVMTPDGRFAPWTSPNGTPMSLAGAAPAIPWSSLVFSLVPNGRSLDYTITQPGDLGEPAAHRAPVGVEKQSFVSGLFALGQASGTYALPMQNPDDDLISDYARINAGEPYADSTIDGIFSSFTRYRDSYELLNGETLGGTDTVAPAPLLIANGWTDDLFPVDENVRFMNLLHQRFPDVPIDLVDMDYGHQRGQGKDADHAYLYGRIVDWFEHYVKGTASVDTGPRAVARTETCPKSAPSVQFTADSWSALHPGQLRYGSAPAQTVLSTGGNPNNAKTFDPIAGGGACATVPDDNEPGSALYTLPAATGSGYTLLGAPTITADLEVTGLYPELVSRLLDVAPDGSRTLIARGIYRPDSTGQQVFQLHPGAWHFAAGHKPELELLGQDVPYARKSNGQFQIAVSKLEAILPTHETSGNGIVAAEPLPLPVGAVPALPGTTTTKGGPYGGGGAPKGAGRKVTPRLAGLTVFARQRRGRRTFAVSARGRLAHTLGRRCSGRVALGVRFRGRLLGVKRLALSRRCAFRGSATFRVRRLGRHFVPRRRRVSLRVTLRYGGGGALRPAKARRMVRLHR